jgi:hypothetical protein
MNSQREKELDIVMEWVTEQISSKGQVPRVSDVVHYTYTTLGFRQLKSSAIARRLRLHQAYVMTSPQSRGLKRSKRYRPIVTNTLGMLHGDIGYFPLTRQYQTPATYRSGFLVLCDVLSRYLYVAIVRKNKSAEAMIRAFAEIFEQHKAAFGPSGHKIVSISFDQETSVMSKKVQDFLRDNNIKFHAFKFSSSKSKMAENAIKLIRNTIAKHIKQNPYEYRWWHLIDAAVHGLNHRQIVIRGHRLHWRPRDVTVSTLDEFLRDVYKANPVQHFSQYEIAPHTVSFKYSVNTTVRPKLIVTSSAVIGEKRSAISVEEDSFIVTEQIAYVNARFEIGRAYRCVNKRTLEEEIFDEDDLAEST